MVPYRPSHDRSDQSQDIRESNGLLGGVEGFEPNNLVSIARARLRLVQTQFAMCQPPELIMSIQCSMFLFKTILGQERQQPLGFRSPISQKPPLALTGHQITDQVSDTNARNTGEGRGGKNKSLVNMC